MRKGFVITAIIAIVLTVILSFTASLWWLVALAFVLLVTGMGVHDMNQKKHSIMRTYPVLGRMRYWMEELRPKMYQYFVESDIDGRPINRIDRSTIYQRAKSKRTLCLLDAVECI